jgi:CHAT domain-containing protein/Flp pilus assembly protein TadD
MKQFSLIIGCLLLLMNPSRSASSAQVLNEPIESLTTVQSRRDALSRLIAERERLLNTGDQTSLVRVSNQIVELHLKLFELDAALVAANESLKIARQFAGTPDANLLADTLIITGRSYIRRNENQNALRQLNEALVLCQQLKYSEGEAQTYAQIGVANFELGKNSDAEKTLVQAIQIWQEHPDKRGEAHARTTQGEVYIVLDRPEESNAALKSAEAIWRSVGDPDEIANNLLDQNFLAIRQGQWQAALVLLDEAESLLVEKEAEPYVAGKVAMSLGDVYEAYGQLETSLAYYREALTLYRDVARDKRAVIDAANQVGRLQARLRDFDGARKQIEEALAIAVDIGNNMNIGLCHEVLGRVWLEAGSYESARTEFLTAISYLSKAPRPLARCQIYLGQTEYLLGNLIAASQAYGKALRMFESKAVNDYTNEAALRFGLGKLALQQKRFDDADKHLRRSIELTKQLRENAFSKDLRSSFLASVHYRYEAYVELLMTRFAGTGDRALEIEAFEANESGRALALLDSLRNQQKEIRRPSDPLLLIEEKRLQEKEQRLRDALAELVSRGGSEQDREKVSADLTDVRSRYETLQARINTSTKFTNLLWPEPDYKNIRDQLIDSNTTLLEYSLGDTNSFAWIITQNGLTSRKLEDKHVIEKAVDQLFTLLQKPLIDSGDEARLQSAINDVSRLVLEPVSDQLHTSRLIVVADGGLQRVPFQVLKAFPGASDPLVAQFEIVDAASATALASVRQERMHRQPGTKMVVGFGDAIFAQDSSKPAPDDRKTGRAGETRNLTTLPMLFHAKRELRAIEDLTGDDSAFYTKYAATRDNFLNINFSQFRIVHVVTHGILNDVEPQLSGLYLTRVDANNQPLAGFVGLTDIYKMNTSVDLVVLSACQTALGKELRGEGLIGLTRGFMYAGAASVVATLWQVDDAASAELMKYFYTYLLRDGMTPPAALRAAQNKIRSQPKWRSPFYWAGFTIQGDYDLNFKSPDRTTGKLQKLVIILVGSMVLIAMALWYIRRGYIRRQSTSKR